MKRRALTPEESALWRKVARSASPLPGKSLPPEEAAPVQAPTKPVVSHAPVSLKKPTPQRHHPGPLEDRGGEKRVRRGRLEIAAKLDLHGHTQDSARAALRDFLGYWRGEGASVVLVVTGKGRAGEEGVLKRRVPDWLGGELRPLLSGFAEAHRRHGGSGAIYVFLKRA